MVLCVVMWVYELALDRLLLANLLRHNPKGAELHPVRTDNHSDKTTSVPKMSDMGQDYIKPKINMYKADAISGYKR